jgi:hypothetical protein
VNHIKNIGGVVFPAALVRLELVGYVCCEAVLNSRDDEICFIAFDLYFGFMRLMSDCTAQIANFITDLKNVVFPDRIGWLFLVRSSSSSSPSPPSPSLLSDETIDLCHSSYTEW